MKDIVFARTRHVYDSYTDFWKLAELCDFETVYVDEIDIGRNAVYITAPFNGEWQHVRNHLGDVRNAYLVLWNLERPSGSGGVGEYARSNRELLYNRELDDVWVSDRQLGAETGFRFVVLGSHYNLGTVNERKKWEFCHMSYVVNRRKTIYDQFMSHMIGYNCWGSERDEVLSGSKFALNVHQDIYPFQEPLRFALFAAYGLPIITETIKDSYPWAPEYMVYSSYDDIVKTLRGMMNSSYMTWRDMAIRARDRMCDEYSFKDMVESAMEDLR